MNLVRHLHQVERISEVCLFEGKGQGLKGGQRKCAKGTCGRLTHHSQFTTRYFQFSLPTTPSDLSNHAQLRAKQRGLSEGDITYVLHYGHCIHAAGALICYLRRIDIPEVHRKEQMRLEGTAVFVAIDSKRVITVWRNRLHGTRNLHRKLTQVWVKEWYENQKTSRGQAQRVVGDDQRSTLP
ncbi:MAG: DUF4258 domain-containing protein [Caldilineaceae bacterium]